MAMDEPFDDFLDLAARDLSRHRLIVFQGASGSGKTTALRFLLERHRDFSGRRYLYLQGPPFADRAWPRVIAVDEATGAEDLRLVDALLGRGKTVLMATHVGVGWLRLRHPLMRAAVFRTDTGTPKIARYLRRRAIAASAETVEAYVRRFGATYTDVDLVLERSPGSSFDQALARFLRFCTLRIDPLRQRHGREGWASQFAVLRRPRDTRVV
jgi:energy-coupling factor transporter ATP-binding protein EcfA2